MAEGKILKYGKMLENKDISCKELTENFLSEIETANRDLNAYVTVTADVALNTAKIVDEKLAKGEECGELIDEKVMAYIAERGIYRD